MEYTQRVAGYVTNDRGKLDRAEFFLYIDSEALTLSGHDLSGRFDQHAESFADLEDAYRGRVKALFESDVFHDPFCVEGGPIEDLASHLREMRACGFDRVVQPFDLDDRLDVEVAALCTELQRELNRAFGPEPGVVENVLLRVDAGRIRLAYVNTPAFLGLDEEEIERIEDGGWKGGSAPSHRRLALPIAHEDFVFTPEPWLKSNPSYEFLSAFLDLVEVRLEVDPGFRENLTASPSLRFLHAIHDDLWFSVEDRRLAREYIDKPAKEYFARRYAKLPRT